MIEAQEPVIILGYQSDIIILDMQVQLDSE